MKKWDFHVYTISYDHEVGKMSTKDISLSMLYTVKNKFCEETDKTKRKNTAHIGNNRKYELRKSVDILPVM